MLSARETYVWLYRKLRCGGLNFLSQLAPHEEIAFEMLPFRP